MDPSYETVVDTTNLLWTVLVYGLHAAIAFFHAALSCYLLASGAHGLFLHHRAGALRLLLGLLLLAPLMWGAPMMVSLVAGLGAFALLLHVARGLSENRRSPGRFVRGGAVAIAAVVSFFMVWEGEDNLTLGTDLLVQAAEWRNEEITWQLAQDVKSPKAGDLAPDFELLDPEGNAQVRLSDFRGRLPVALVFGSYT
ncbi:MAG: hypothetical protein GY723_11990 [bacterium]|nr:hypothetical protein [bacterium]MCP5067844.1 hypothetical protein [bacterium]